jgi:prevent-host-death family protein
MREIAISEFKAKCLSLLEQVQKTKAPIRITRRGKPVADVVPADPVSKKRRLGDMAGSGKILGDIISPVLDVNDFEAYRD